MSKTTSNRPTANSIGREGGSDPGTEVLGSLGVGLQQSRLRNVEAHPFYVAIANRTESIRFQRYSEFVDRALCGTEGEGGSLGPPVCSPGGQDRHGDSPSLQGELARARAVPQGVQSYEILKVATEIFLLLECGVVISPPRTTDGTPGAGTAVPPSDLLRLDEVSEADGELPTWDALSARLKTVLESNKYSYIDAIVKNVFGDQKPVSSPFCTGIMTQRLHCPCLLELIWSYWCEEGMLVQTLNAISRRFQNRRRPGPGADPLAELAIDPLRPLGNLLWGYIQDERQRLSVKRRAYEYDHHYGLPLVGRALPTLRSADSRSKFHESFHGGLIRACIAFYDQDSDATRVSDGFPVLNALKQVHMLLAQGAHNQFGDLPWTARVEMMTQQWLLARPEMRDFLRGRLMVPYTEPWMGAVDAMSRLQGWGDLSVLDFGTLATFGERLLLSVRHVNWVSISDQEEARTWARYWKPEVQSYVHAYKAVTGADLADLRRPFDSTVPGLRLERRRRNRPATA